MSEPLTRSQEAAAFHGLATNKGFGINERLEMALRALDLYEAEVEELRASARDLAIHREENMALTDWPSARLRDEVERLRTELETCHRRGFDQAIEALRGRAQHMEDIGSWNQGREYRAVADDLASRYEEENP